MVVTETAAMYLKYADPWGDSESAIKGGWWRQVQYLVEGQGLKEDCIACLALRSAINDRMSRTHPLAVEKYVKKNHVCAGHLPMS